MAEQPKTAEDVKAIVEERDIRFIRFWFTDILGQLKSFSINKEELDDAFEGGMGFDGSSILAGRLSPDGSRLAFTYSRTGRSSDSELWLANSQGEMENICH